MQLRVTVECVALDGLDHNEIASGSDRSKPQLDRAPALYPVWSDENTPSEWPCFRIALGSRQ